MKKLFTIAFALSVFCAASAQEDGDGEFNAVVKIDTIFCAPNYTMPWAKNPQQKGSGSGVVIGGGRILTAAHNVADSTYITVSRGTSGNRVPAKVEAVDHQCDLAVLSVADADFLEGITPMEIGQTPPVRSQVIAAGFPMGGNGLSITQGIVSRIETVDYAHTIFDNLLAAQLDAAINPGNSGGPVIADGKLVGIAFQDMREGEGLGYMIHTDIIRRFLADAEDGRIDGFGETGLVFEPLENPDMRKFLKMGKKQTGVMVCRVLSHARCTPEIKAGDVIVSIDSTPVMNNGNIRNKRGETLTYRTIIDNKQVGDFVTFGVLRQGEAFQAKAEIVKPWRAVAPKTYDIQPSYFVVGGFAFVKLSVNYLAEFDGAPPDYLTCLLDKNTQSPEDETIVLSCVMGDDANLGYGEISDRILTRVNGKKVRNLKQLSETVDAMSEGFVQFELDDSTLIIADIQKLKAANSRIARNYLIHSDRSPDLRAPTALENIARAVRKTLTDGK